MASDEWIEGRNLRRQGAPPPEPAQLAPQREPASAPPTAAYPSDFVPRLLTTTGELKPLTDDVIAEIDALLAAHAKGDAPPGFLPQYEAPGGEMVLLTRRAFEELVTYARRSRGQQAPRDEAPPGSQTDAVQAPPATAAQPSSDPRDFISWFDTVDGDLPPVHADDVVDAEWVIAVGDRLRGAPPGQRRGERGPLAERGPLTSQIIEFIRARRWGWRQVLLLLAAVLVTALAVFVPVRLALAPEDAGPAHPSGDDAAPGDAGAAPPPATVPPTLPPTPALAPHQQGRIAFAASPDGHFDIFVLDLASSEVARLTDSLASDRSPTWSPDGSRIVFVSDRAGDDDLYVMDADGSNVVQLTTSSALDHTPVWSPDGSRVAFSRETVAGSSLMAFDAACMATPGACEDAVEALTSDRYDLYPAWSPDGAQLAFAAADFPGLPSTLALLALADGGFTRLAGTGSSDFSPAWSPDGVWLAFVSYNFGDYDLWLVGVDGEGLAQVTRDEASDVQPVWSPDGQYLVFASDRGEAGSFDLYAMRAGCALGLEQTPPTEGDDPPPPSPCEAEAIQLTDSDHDNLDPAWMR